VSRTYWVETLGCPKNQVDSDKLIGTLHADGLVAAESADEADLVVVNTCAFVAEAREESVATILALEDCLAVEVDKATLATIIGTSPELLESLSELLAQRRMKNEGLVAESAGTSGASKQKNYKAGFLDKLRLFFEV